MKKLLATCAIAALGLAPLGALGAQEAPAEESAIPEVAPPADDSASVTIESETRASLTGAEGQAVYNLEGDEIGSIETVIDGENGQEAVVGVGGFLGIGQKKVLLSAGDLEARAEGGFTTSLSADALKAMPEYEAPAEEAAPADDDGGATY